MPERDLRHLLDRIDGWKKKLEPFIGAQSPPEAVQTAVRNFHHALDVLDRWIPDQGVIVEMEGGVARTINDTLKVAADGAIDRLVEEAKRRLFP